MSDPVWRRRSGEVGVTLGQLRTFVALAEAGSVRGAAERLMVSQPAVSSALAALQRAVGVALVTRQGRGAVLTPAGHAFADYAHRVFGLLDEATTVAAGHADPRRGRLRLAAVTTAGERIVPGLLASFRARHPEVEVALDVGNRARVWELLDHHDVDLAFAGRPPATGSLASLASRPNPLVVAATGSGRTARHVGIEDLHRATWLLREPGSGTREACEQLFQELDIQPPLLTLGSNGAIREGVQIGLGITLISRAAVDAELSTGRIEEWRCGPLPLSRRWHVVGRPGELGPTAELFLRHITDRARSQERFERNGAKSNR